LAVRPVNKIGDLTFALDIEPGLTVATYVEIFELPLLLGDVKATVAVVPLVTVTELITGELGVTGQRF
jgi:hypothetical protein